MPGARLFILYATASWMPEGKSSSENSVAQTDFIRAVSRDLKLTARSPAPAAFHQLVASAVILIFSETAKPGPAPSAPAHHQGAMNQITGTASFTLPAGGPGFDPIEERLRANVRATIEAVFEEELAGFLGRRRYGRGASPAKG